MADYEDVYAPDLTEETESTLSGSEQFVMFDSVEGKRAELSTIADYIVENGEIDGSDIPTIVSTIEGNIGTVDTKVGDLTDLETTDKTSIVSAVNEVNGKAEDADEKADTVDEHVGDLSDLETEDKTSAVDAINEVLSKIPVMTKEVTGNPITMDDALGAVDSLTVELEPIQTGTPSPSSPAPITGHDSVTITDTDGTSTNTTTVTLPSTVYGGTVGVTSGTGQEEYVKMTVTAFTGQDGQVTNGFCAYANLTDTNRNVSLINPAMMKSNMFTYSSLGRASAPALSYGGNNGSLTLQMFILPRTITSLEEANEWLANLDTPLECTFRKATPTDLTTTPTDITLYNGDNVVSSDGNMDMVYVQDIVKVIEKLEG